MTDEREAVRIVKNLTIRQIAPQLSAASSNFAFKAQQLDDHASAADHAAGFHRPWHDFSTILGFTNVRIIVNRNNRYHASSLFAMRCIRRRRIVEHLFTFLAREHELANKRKKRENRRESLVGFDQSQRLLGCDAIVNKSFVGCSARTMLSWGR